MGLLNALIAFITLMVMLISMVKTFNIALNTEYRVCSCNPEIKKISKTFIICFKDCKIKPVNSYLYNESCSFMEPITITVCNGDRYISTKPEEVIIKPYIWEVYLQKVWKIMVTVSTWLLLVFAKTPILYLFRFTNTVINKIFNSRLNKCDSCQSKYLVSHIDCPTPLPKSRTEYNLFFYLMLILITVGTLARADDNIYNQYIHENSTEIQLLDKEHYKQDFDVDGYLYTFTILNSHLELSIVNVSEILLPVKHSIDKITYSCDGHDGCKSELNKQKLNNGVSEWYIKKVYDGFSCLTTTATICGTCRSDFITVGHKVIVVDSKPYIDIEIKHGNKSEIIKIRDFLEYIHEPYYVKPLKPITTDINRELFISNHKVYHGQLCAMPSFNCFGPNYKKDNKSYFLNKPKVKDTLTHDREVILECCVNPGNTDINSLSSTDYVYNNNTIIKPFEYGMISIGIPLLGKLTGDFCEEPAEVTKINVHGCYDCQQGIEIEVNYKSVDRCSIIKCNVGSLRYSYFVSYDNHALILHSFYDRQRVDISCNDFDKTFYLDDSKDTSYYKTSSEVHGGAPYDFNIMKHIPNLLANYKTMLTTLMLLIISVFLIYKISTSTIKHIIRILKNKKLKKYKKTDIIDDNIDVLSIIVGDPD
ncbi:glycoprotein precursor [Maple mottle-associated virus]|uniref:Glycoprotein n=1 Tax=Maple mottle-associated virus TaxID=2778521 RepID=A0A7L8Y977_9VIRU|nr:glycoprotein precursor [Maple mottle-associated virus]QOI17316.1 glycoprotein precursor [Maple mottle-associated virus]